MALAPRGFHSKPRKNTSCHPINAENATVTARFAHLILGTLDAFNDCDWRVRVRFDEDRFVEAKGGSKARGLNASRCKGYEEPNS